LDRRAEELADRFTREQRMSHADVDVKLAPRERNAVARLLLSNAGPAAASNVSISFVRPLSGDGGRDGAFDLLEPQRFELAPGGSQHLALSPDGEIPSRYEVAVQWTDPAGEHERLRVISHSFKMW
jgi:hypothetical protein